MVTTYLLHSEVRGQEHDETVILIPGLFGSTRFWHPIMDRLHDRYRVISVDPLGFGHSPKPFDAHYSVEDHIESIKNTLDHLAVQKPAIIVGHSMGSLLALYIAEKYPEHVKQLILVSMPVITSEREAFLHISHQTLLPSFLLHGKNSRLVCETFCYRLRPLTIRFLQSYLPTYQQEILQDSLLHRYYSYKRTLDNVVMDQHLERAFSHVHVPIAMLYGEKDNRLQLEHIEKIRSWKDGVRIDLYERAGHMLPLEFPEEVIKHIRNPEM